MYIYICVCGYVYIYSINIYMSTHPTNIPSTTWKTHGFIGIRSTKDGFSNMQICWGVRHMDICYPFSLRWAIPRSSNGEKRNSQGTKLELEIQQRQWLILHLFFLRFRKLDTSPHWFYATCPISVTYPRSGSSWHVTWPEFTALFRKSSVIPWFKLWPFRINLDEADENSGFGSIHGPI